MKALAPPRLPRLGGKLGRVGPSGGLFLLLCCSSRCAGARHDALDVDAIDVVSSEDSKFCFVYLDTDRKWNYDEAKCDDTSREDVKKAGGATAFALDMGDVKTWGPQLCVERQDHDPDCADLATTLNRDEFREPFAAFWSRYGAGESLENDVAFLKVVQAWGRQGVTVPDADSEFCLGLFGEHKWFAGLDPSRCGDDSHSGVKAFTLNPSAFCVQRLVSDPECMSLADTMNKDALGKTLATAIGEHGGGVSLDSDPDFAQALQAWRRKV